MEERNQDLEERRKQLVEQLAMVSADLSAAREETRRLRSAIETHREQTGHNLCWLNDVKLWEALGDGKTNYPHDTLPPEEEFAMGCKAYYRSRLKEVDEEKKCCGGNCGCGG